MAVSAEVLCRHSFGQRYAPQLIGSFLLAFVYAGLTEAISPQQPVRLMSAYLLLHFVLVSFHLARSFRPQTVPLHSYSTGQSWPVWRRLRLKPSVVQLLFEPGLVALVGVIVHPADIGLSVWLQTAGLCLFLKELIVQWKLRKRLLDALDARAEGERMNTSIRQRTASASDGGQTATPVATAQPAAQPRNPLVQVIRNLDPALQRLLSSGNRTHPNLPAPTAPPNRHEPRRHHAGPLGALPRITSRSPRSPG